MQSSPEQDLMRELIVVKAEYDDLNKKIVRIGRKIYRRYKKLSELLDKEK